MKFENLSKEKRTKVNLPKSEILRKPELKKGKLFSKSERGKISALITAMTMIRTVLLI